MEKTKIGGIYFNTKTNKYDVSTTFTLLDKTHKRETKRGFNTLKEANTWKVNRANELNSMSSDDVKTNNKDWRVLLDEYIKYKSNTNKPIFIICFYIITRH